VLVAVSLALLALTPARARRPEQAPWRTLERPPPMPPLTAEGRVTHAGVRIWFGEIGSGSPVILLHGGGGDSGNWGGQVPPLVADGHRVILIDSRGQGRSGWDGRPLAYEEMESDVIAVMDKLGVSHAAVVGWSDGAIIGLVMAMKHPDRVTRVFAFGANMNLKGVNPDAEIGPVLARGLAFQSEDYARLNPAPGDHDALLQALETLWDTQPNYTAKDLGGIAGPAIAIADGEHEEFISRTSTEYLARAIPHAQLIILPGVSHFAPLQDPAQFNKAMLDFLDAR
jgi:pimeloyl-ACP methyl ester carboxylesterase